MSKNHLNLNLSDRIPSSKSHFLVSFSIFPFFVNGTSFHIFIPPSILSLPYFRITLFRFRFLLMWNKFKVFIEFITDCWNVAFLATSVCDLSSWQDSKHTACIGRQSLNYWTAREIPRLILDGPFVLYLKEKKIKFCRLYHQMWLETG